jgi:hypothetical protein
MFLLSSHAVPTPGFAGRLTKHNGPDFRANQYPPMHHPLDAFQTRKETCNSCLVGIISGNSVQGAGAGI